MEKVIFHIDMDAFFASIEIAKNPDLEGKPVIVGGLPERRGVVSTCNYEARRYGVRSAMSSIKALKLCPHAVFLQGNHQLYKAVSQEVMRILARYSPTMEKVSIDEAYLDLTHISHRISDENERDVLSAIDIAKEIKESILKRLNLTCSIGIGPNRMIAKILSSTNKPNGLKRIKKEEVIPFLKPLSVSLIPGIGPKTALSLKSEGIEIVEDIWKKDLKWLIDRFGARGYFFYCASRGKTNDIVHTEKNKQKSIGKEITFAEDTSDMQFLMDTLERLTKSSQERLKKEGLKANSLSIKLRFEDFTTITRSITLNNTTDRFENIFKAAKALFVCHYHGKRPLRLIGVTLENLTDGYWQPTFWDI